MTIKNAETLRLARELASLTGESMTVAVAEAVRERLERVRLEQGDNLADRLLEIGCMASVGCRSEVDCTGRAG